MTPTGTTFELVRERSIDLAALRHRCPSLVAGALISLVYLSPLAHLAHLAHLVYLAPQPPSPAEFTSEAVLALVLSAVPSVPTTDVVPALAATRSPPVVSSAVSCNSSRP